MKQSYVLRANKKRGGYGRKLADALKAPVVVALKRPLKRIKDNAIIINYGRSVSPIWLSDVMDRGGTIINHPAAVRLSVDKRSTFTTLSAKGVKCLPYTMSKAVAQAWSDQGKDVIVRRTSTGQGGKGVELFEANKKLPEAPLYTIHIPKTHELRVHIAGGKVIDYVQKKRMGKAKREARGLVCADELVRNHKRGWVFARKDILRTEEIEQLAIDATAALGLNYCAVDILAVSDEKGTEAWVCETNTAPGFGGETTFNAYIKYFEELAND